MVKYIVLNALILEHSLITQKLSNNEQNCRTKSVGRISTNTSSYNTNIEAEENVKHAFNREGYIKGYDQAMQDFLEKAELFFNYELYVSLSDQICSLNDFTSMSNFVEYFKNYMKNEIQD